VRLQSVRVPWVEGSVSTTAERERYIHDEVELGARVALWLASERRGWSPLWDDIYWSLVAKGQPWVSGAPGGSTGSSAP